MTPSPGPPAPASLPRCVATLAVWLLAPALSFYFAPAVLAAFFHTIGRPMNTAGTDLWLPRYLAMIWPAFAIAVGALLLRIPSRPLKWAAIGLLLAANLGQFTLRVFGPSEPPIDRMAADLIDSDMARQEPSIHLVRFQKKEYPAWSWFTWRKNPTTRVYIQIAPVKIPAPGEARINDRTGAYFLALASGLALRPFEIRAGRPIEEAPEFLARYRAEERERRRQESPAIVPPPRPPPHPSAAARPATRTAPQPPARPIPGDPPKVPWVFGVRFDLKNSWIANEVALSPKLQRIIIWDMVPPGDQDADDPWPLILGPDWRCLSEQQFPVRIHWTWQNMGTMRRWEFVRNEASLH